MKKSTRILRKEADVPVQKIIGDLLGAVGLKQYEDLEEKYENKPVRRSDPDSQRGDVGHDTRRKKDTDKSRRGIKKQEVPVQKIIGKILGTLGLSKTEEVPVQKIIGKLLGTLGLSKQPSDPPHGPTTPMMPSGSLGMGKGDKPVQKIGPAILAPLAVGAIGGKLLGLSKKEGVPVQKIIPGLSTAMEGVGSAVGGAGKAVGAVGDVASGAASGIASGVGQTAGAVGDVAGAAGKKVAGAINPTKSQLAKHRTKKLHSHKRNPFRGRK